MRSPKAEFIPSGPEELTPQWLTDQLRLAEMIDHDVAVVSFTTKPIANGVGMAGTTERVLLTYDTDRAGLPASVIGKFAATNPETRGMVESLDIYGREIAFYQGLARRLPIPVPQFCGGECDPATGEMVARIGSSVVDRLPQKAQLAITEDVTKVMRPSKRRYALLIEDLGEGHVVHDIVSPPPLTDLEPVLEQLAAVHASFWGEQSLLDHPSTRWLITPTPRLYRNVYRGRCKALMQDRWGDWMTDRHWTVIESAMDGLEGDLKTINQPVTLVHGDPRSDNVLYGADGPRIVDWALLAFGHPAFDVGYLLGSSVRIEDMAQHAEPLAQKYLQALAAQGRTMAFDRLWAGVGATARAVLAQAIMGLPHPLADYGEDGRAEDYWAPRLIALADLFVA